MLIHIHVSINTYWQKHKTGVAQQRGEEGKGRWTKREVWEAKRCRERKKREGWGKSLWNCAQEKGMYDFLVRKEWREEKAETDRQWEEAGRRRRRRCVRLGVEMEIWAMCLPCSQKHKSTWDNVFESHILRMRPKYTEWVRLVFRSWGHSVSGKHQEEFYSPVYVQLLFLDCTYIKAQLIII